MKWRTFIYSGTRYDLAHVHPRTCDYVQPAKDTNPAHAYTVEVMFSHHCFTRRIKENEQPDPALLYSDARGDTRVFDFDRYTLSQQLPRIVAQFDRCKCYHTGHGNYFTIEIMDAQGKRLEYDVFFTVSRASRRGVLNLYVQTAFVRDAEYSNRPHRNLSRRPNLRPIGFYVILYNTMTGKLIKPPK